MDARLEQSRDKPPADVSGHASDQDVWRSAFGAQRLAFSVQGLEFIVHGSPSPFAVVYNRNHENTYIYKIQKQKALPRSLRPANAERAAERRTLSAERRTPNVQRPLASRTGHGYFAGTYGS
jgi:hypothetical protein